MAVNYVEKGTATVGTRHKVATYQFSQTGQNVEVQRVALTGQNGEEIGQASAQTAPVELNLDTANTPEIVVAAGTKVGWLIYNNSGATIYMGFHSTVASTNGIPIPNNGSYQQSGPGIFTGDVYCVATTNNKTLRVQQW